MRYPVDDFETKWYNAQPFGAVTTYGYHEGDDFNLKTGGDSDLGQPLYAVASGRIVYFHNASHPSSGFGRHMVLEVDTVRGKRWYHYCHCDSITTETKDVKEGDKIGVLGKSGTSSAHLHFSVFKVNPGTLSSGIDSIAKNSNDLNSQWEKFELLQTGEDKVYTEAEMTKVREERDSNWNNYQASLEIIKKQKEEYSKSLASLEEKLQQMDGEANTLKLDLSSRDDRIEVLSSNIESLQLQVDAKISEIEELKKQLVATSQESENCLNLGDKSILNEINLGTYTLVVLKRKE